MKRLLLTVAVLLPLLGLLGCELFEDQPEWGDLTFENASRFTVTVYPLTTQWGAFSLAPTDTKNLGDIRDADFRYEPKLKVQLGKSSTSRNVVFVDAPPIEK